MFENHTGSSRTVASAWLLSAWVAASQGDARIFVYHITVSHSPHRNEPVEVLVHEHVRRDRTPARAAANCLGRPIQVSRCSS